MKKENSIKKVLKKIYRLLDKKQKIEFIVIVLIMILSAGLTQLTPKTIGWLTDDILTKNNIQIKIKLIIRDIKIFMHQMTIYIIIIHL